MIGTRLTAEHAYLMELVKAFVAGDPNPPSAPDAFDWDRFGTVVAQHPRALLALMPLITRADAPWEVTTRLAASAKPLRDHTRLVMHQFICVVAAFEHAEVDFIVLKGPVLAATLYPNPESRFITDIDLLVQPNTLPDAKKLLESLGFESPELLRSEKFYREQHFHYIFANTVGIQVELHWQLTEPDDYVQFNLNDIRQHVRPVSISHANQVQTVNAFGCEDGLLHIVSQAMPGFESLGRLIDACLILIQHDTPANLQHQHGCDMETLAAKAKRHNLATPLWLILKLALEVVGVEQSGLQQRVQPSWLRQFALSSLPIKQRLSAAPDRHTGLSHLLYLLCCPAIKHATRYAGRIVWPGEKQLYRLGVEPSNVTRRQIWRLRASGFGVLAKMSGYLVWRMVRAAFVRHGE